MDLKKLCRRILFPPVWLILILIVISTAGLIYVFVNGYSESVVSVPVYVLSFYTLTVFCLICVYKGPIYVRRIREICHGSPLADRYFTDKVFKTHITLYRSLIINLIYVVVNAVSAILYHTSWFGIYAVYYGIMAVMRFLLAGYMRRNTLLENRLRDLRRARLCAGILLTMNAVLTGAVLMMVHFGRGFTYSGILIYVMAMYTFYSTTSAVVEMVKYRKYNSPIMSVSKMVKLAAALVSMLSLETAMFAQFGADTSQQFKDIMLMATGGGISLIVVSLSLFMIVRTTGEIRRMKHTET